MIQFSDDEVRTSIIDEIQATATIMAKLSDASEIRELDWSGSDFSYPNYRVRINSLNYFDDCYQEASISVYGYSESYSSKEAGQMAKVVANHFHNRGFTRTGITFAHTKATIIPAIKQGNLTWRSEVQINSIVS